MGMSVQKVGVANKEYEPGLSVSSCEFVLALLMSLEPYVLAKSINSEANSAYTTYYLYDDIAMEDDPKVTFPKVRG